MTATPPRSARLSGIGTAVPAHKHDQGEILDTVFSALPGWDPAWAEVFKASGVSWRATVLDDLAGFYGRVPSTAERMRVFSPAARRLGAEAARRALAAAGGDGGGTAGQVGELLTVSCTGYHGPGLDVHLAADLGLGRHVRRLAIGHMGCYAALPALRAAAALATASGRAALVACVELCTLHLQPPVRREEVVQFALFADGAAAAVVAPDGPPDGPPGAGLAGGLRGGRPGTGGGPAAATGGAAGPAADHAAAPGGGAGDEAAGLATAAGPATVVRPEIVAGHTVTVPASEERMGWEVADDGFRMWLSPRVPALVERGIDELVDGLLTQRGLARSEIGHWVVHPGGPEILERVQRRLRLPPGALDLSWSALAEGGNRSSATVLFILEDLLASGTVEPGAWICVLAFGTGLTLEGLLLRA